MRLLVDTHCWLWQLDSPERLNDAAREALTDGENEIFFSAASVWEIVIKTSIGKLSLPVPPREFIPSRLAALRHQSLAITQAHALALASLPLHHRDPFDRILIAQTRSEGLTLVTADAALVAYDVEILWANTTPAPSRPA